MLQTPSCFGYDNKHHRAQITQLSRMTHMAGLERSSTHPAPVPTEIKLRQKSRVMELSFSDGRRFELSYEFLRVFSPSAEVRGHGPGQETLQTGKKNVDIVSLEPVGSYAVQPTFSDGHATGLYSWDYLYELGVNRDALWQDYLDHLAAAGASREVDTTTPPPRSGGACGAH